MRLTLTALALLPTPALAHIGHIGELGGHDHWIALGGIAIAAGIALWGARKGKKADEDTEAAPAEEETEEAPA